MSGLPPEAFAAALAGVDMLTPLRLRALLGRLDPESAWVALCRGSAFPAGLPTPTRKKDPASAIREGVRSIDPAEVWDSCLRLGVAVHVLGWPDYPAALGEDVEAPAVLFTRGNVAALGQRRVAIVGTRRATAGGRELAFALGRSLAQHGITVVSGLAAGIDGAAHRGVLAVDAAPPVGVVGSGLDVPYPSGHRSLWESVATRGVLLAEVPPGSEPAAYRFPQRNRIIAALSEVVVVVESRERGGSLLTVDQAMDRGRIVMAVPGSPRSPASMGTNELLRDGTLPVHDVNDVLLQLGLGRLPFASRLETRPQPDPADQEVLDFVSGHPTMLEEVASGLQRSFVSVAMSLARLELHGWVVETAGAYESIAACVVRGPVP
jgi:DNA processing protein